MTGHQTAHCFVIVDGNKEGPRVVDNKPAEVLQAWTVGTTIRRSKSVARRISG